VQRPVFDNFISRFVEVAKNLRTGNVFEDDNVFYGPLINKSALDKVLFYNELTRQDKDVKIHLDGKQIGKDGCFVSPHVYETAWGDKRFLKEEVFGPHVAIIPFDTVEDAIDIYNDTEYGLALGVITNNYKIMRKCQQECDTGMLYINGSSIGAESHLPFSGVKKSGSGWPSAAGTYEAVTNKLAVTINYSDTLQFAQGLK